MQALCRYEEIREVHVELTSRCQAACPMCARNLHGGRTRANLPLEDIALADFRAWFPDDFLGQLDNLLMCGNFGDPIVARDCLPICAHARRRNPGIHLSMNTNGSARGRGFWRELARLGVTVRFGIDGATAASHARYRRNTRLATVLANAEAFIAAGGTAIWDMLLFRHNEDEIAAAEAIARSLGFRRFVPKSSNRFGADAWDVRDESGAVVDRLQPSLRHPPIAKPAPEVLTACAIDCRVARTRSIYVSAGGLVFPCCWLAQLVFDRPGAPDSRSAQPFMADRIAGLLEMVEEIGPGNLDLHRTPLADIVDHYLPRFARGWVPGSGRLEQCARTCGRHGPDRIASEYVREPPRRPGRAGVSGSAGSGRRAAASPR
jgi:MoaA/NifB/PqqE/SkfB family radical SAM enzyme